MQQVANDQAIPSKNNLFIVPSIQVTWTPESVWNTGIVGSYSNSLSALAVERYVETFGFALDPLRLSFRYPDDNCAALFPALGTPQVPQDIFINYLQHNASTSLISSYLNSSAFALANGKPLIMFETNTASCSGFPGISDSFGAALWGLDWALQMAYNNFSAALFHVGGQNAYYNPFTPPPTNQTKYGAEWTVGPIYYSALVMAEALGPHNLSQVSDITQNINTPIYAIYEKGVPTKVALFNFITDPTGASSYTAVISIGGGSTGQSNATPSQVQVKYVLIKHDLKKSKYSTFVILYRYLLAESIASINNFTWAGQVSASHILDPYVSFASLNCAHDNSSPTDAGSPVEIRWPPEWHGKRNNGAVRPNCQYMFNSRASTGLRARIPHFRLPTSSLAYLDRHIPNDGDDHHRQ